MPGIRNLCMWCREENHISPPNFCVVISGHHRRRLPSNQRRRKGEDRLSPRWFNFSLPSIPKTNTIAAAANQGKGGFPSSNDVRGPPSALQSITFEPFERSKAIIILLNFYKRVLLAGGKRTSYNRPRKVKLRNRPPSFFSCPIQ